jgi:DNA-binding XRE family transcriptional regulator
MATQPSPYVSPVGENVTEHRARKARENPKYAAAVERFSFAEQIARLLTGYRMEHELTQKQIGELLGMTTPEISRLESGEHTPSGKTTERILRTLHKHVVFVDNDAEADAAEELAAYA